MPRCILSFIWHLHLGVEVREDEVGAGLETLVSNLLPALTPSQPSGFLTLFNSTITI